MGEIFVVHSMLSSLVQTFRSLASAAKILSESSAFPLFVPSLCGFFFLVRFVISTHTATSFGNYSLERIEKGGGRQRFFFYSFFFSFLVVVMFGAFTRCTNACTGFPAIQ